MAEVVASYEEQFADLTDENWLVVTSYVASTLGPNSSVWIHSWNGNTYDGAPLECRGDGSITIGSPAKVQNVLIFQPQIVPEPSTAALVFPGLGVLWWCLRLRGSSSSRKETTAEAGKSRSRFLRVPEGLRCEGPLEPIQGELNGLRGSKPRCEVSPRERWRCSRLAKTNCSRRV